MDHIAIMKKSYGLIEKILSGEKTIESRWYQNRCAPWNKIKAGDTIYFKNSGGLVEVCAKVSKVKQYQELNDQKRSEIISKYGQFIGTQLIPNFQTNVSNKNYCILILLKSAHKIVPFHISKQGFGSACAWIVTEDVDKIKK